MIQKKKTLFSHLHPLKSLVVLEKKTLYLATLCLFVAASVNLVYPHLVGALIDTLTQAVSSKTKTQSLSLSTELNHLFLLLVSLFLLMGGATFGRSYLFTLAGERIVFKLRAQLFNHLLQQEIGLFDQTQSGDWVSRLADDTSKIQRAVTVNLSMLLRYGLSALGCLIILFWISWKLTLVMIFLVPFSVVGAMWYGRRLRLVSRQVQDRFAKASHVVQEVVAGIRTVHAFQGEDFEKKRYQETLDLAFDLAKKRALLGAVFQGGMSLMSYLAIAGVIWYGGHLTLQDQLSLGQLTSFMLYTFTLAFSIGALSGLWEDFSKAFGSTEVIFEFLNRPSLIKEGSMPFPQHWTHLHFNQVEFAYPSRPSLQTLSKLSFSIPAKTTLALVGPSGGGKSTITSLIQRFYDPQDGSITLDSLPLSDLQLYELRSHIAIVQQEPLLFATSIFDNLRYGSPNASLNQVIDAAKEAYAHDFIMSFPNGYQTEVGERGIRLSGGQKQRIAIARALLKDPQILILDEATSALDTESEAWVQKALTRLMQGRTTLMIAHRLSTVKAADHLVVIEDGRVVEEGTHLALLQAQGRYARLIEKQV